MLNIVQLSILCVLNLCGRGSHIYLMKAFITNRQLLKAGIYSTPAFIRSLEHLPQTLQARRIEVGVCSGLCV